MPNPLADYRRAQRRVRALFDPFTREHCPGCTTPCCVRPTRVRPFDLVLLEELGHPPRRAPEATSGGVTSGGATAPVTLGGLGVVELALTGSCSGDGAPCEFLGETGCGFPADLRPFGCAAYICEPMRGALPARELEAVEAAVRELEAAYGALVEAVEAAPPA